MRFLCRLLCSLSILAGLLHADQSSFDSSPGWQEYDPRGEVLPWPTAAFNYGSGKFQITAQQPTTDQEIQTTGYARAGLFAPTVFSDSVVSVDITDWSPTTISRDSSFVDGTFIGVFTRVQSPVTFLGLTGYSASILDMGENSGPGGTGRRARLQLILVYNEFTYLPVATGPEDFPLDPTRDYRLLLVSHGDTHTARVFDLSDPAVPVAEITGYDGILPSGRTGLMILTDRGRYLTESGPQHSSIHATFDNYLAWDGSPCPVVIGSGDAPGTIVLTSDLYRSMATDLQTTTDPAAQWQPAVADAAETSGGNLRLTFNIDAPARFFRRKSL